jgi:hypothetical protein
MTRFVLQCSHGDYLTPTVVSIDAVLQNGQSFLDAVEQIATHVAETHGNHAYHRTATPHDGGPEASWSFSAVEVRSGAGDLWATEVVADDAEVR